jgi:putative hydrolase of the HAD superfamily
MRLANAIDSRPDFRHVEVWIFDLDNTLYCSESGVFAQIERRMTLFVQNLLGLGFEEARRIQKAFYREHGTTLNGLMRVHGIDPEAYLAFVHDIDLSSLEQNPQLASALESLPGRKYVFTNGCRNHATRVLNRLAFAHLFDELWDIRTIAYRPKPDPDSYCEVLARASIEARRSAIFDDIPRNLVPAHELGCTTVWLRNDSISSKQGPEHPADWRRHVDHETDDLCSFLGNIRM